MQHGNSLKKSLENLGVLQKMCIQNLFREYITFLLNDFDFEIKF